MQKLAGFQGHFYRTPDGSWEHRVCGLVISKLSEYTVFKLELGDERPDRYVLMFSQGSPMSGKGKWCVIDSHAKQEFPLNNPVKAFVKRATAEKLSIELNKQWRIT
ncbi:MAG: hypothetical protein ACRCZ9_01970 [Fusobacteriaceae bacterium]